MIWYDIGLNGIQWMIGMNKRQKQGKHAKIVRLLTIIYIQLYSVISCGCYSFYAKSIVALFMQKTIHLYIVWSISIILLITCRNVRFFSVHWSFQLFETFDFVSLYLLASQVIHSITTFRLIQRGPGEGDNVGLIVVVVVQLNVTSNHTLTYFRGMNHVRQRRISFELDVRDKRDKEN